MMFDVHTFGFSLFHSLWGLGCSSGFDLEVVGVPSREVLLLGNGTRQSESRLGRR